MKALSFSKLTFVCAVVLGVIVFWAAAAPSTASTSMGSLGGWVPTWNAVCCYDVTYGEYCEDWGWCYGGPLITCYLSFPTNGSCHATGEWTCKGVWPCTDIHNAACN